MLLYVHRDRTDSVLGTGGAQDVHLDFRTASKLCLTVVHYVHRDRTHYYARGAQDVHLDFHTASELFLTMGSC